MKKYLTSILCILFNLFCFSVFSQNIDVNSPMNNSVLNDTNVLFSWNGQNTNIIIEVSTDSLFISGVVSNSTNGNNFYLNGLNHNTIYFWRIQSFGGVWSSVYKFYTFNLQSISSLNFALNADTQIQLIGNNVSQWSDYLNGYTFSQNQTAFQPSLASYKLNDKPVIHFGKDGNLGQETKLTSNSDYLIEVDSYTFIALFRSNYSNPAGYILSKGANGFFGGGTSGGGREYGVRGDASLLVKSGSLPVNWGIYSFNKTNLYKNGINTVTGSLDYNFLVNQLGVRPDLNSLFFHGDLAEILIFNQELNDSTRTLVEDYLKWKYTPIPNFGNDTVVCASEHTLKVPSDHGYSDITWSNGQTNVDSITATTSGTYWVTVKSFGLELTDTIILDLRDKPQLNFQNDTISCVENNLFLTFSNLGPFQYTWSNGSNADTLQNLQSGTYYISQNDTANGCIINSDEVNVLIDSFSLQSSLGLDRNFCLGSNLELQTTTINNEPYSYQWSTTDTSSFIVLDTPSDTLINTTVTDAFGCIVKDTLLASVLNLASPTVDFISDTVCFGSTTHFNSLSSPSGSDNIINYEWIFPNSSQLNSFDTTSYSHSLDQTFNVNLTVYTDSNCQNSITKPVYIHRLPVVLFNQEIVCAENSSSFSESSYAFFPDNVNTYSWYVNNLFETNTEDPELIFDTEGFNVLKLVIESDFGCIAELQESIEVFPALNADFSTTNSCIGDSVLFTDETESFSVVDWKWTFGSSLTSSLEKPKMLFNTIGNITVSLEIENAIGCKSTISKNVFISPQPQASFSFDKACENDVSLFYDNSVIVNDSIISFDWEIDTFNYNGDSVEHFFSDLSVYNVSLNIETENGCTDETSSLVTVNENPSPSFEFTPNYGTAPLEVHFSNLTPGTNQYTWNFGDTVGLSSDEEPLYTYLQNGIYNITLTAINEHNCDADISQQIAVIPSELDIELKNLEFNIVENTDNTFSISPKLEIRNVGTRLIQDAELVLSLNAENKLVQQWENQLGIGEAMAYSFDSYFLVSDLELSKYICIEAINVNDNTEENLTNNKVCSLVEGLIQFSNPYPNPADNNVFIDIITADKGKCSLQVFDIRGNSIIPANDIQLVKGYNKLQIETSLYQSGKYILMIKYLDENYSKQFLIK